MGLIPGLGRSPGEGKGHPLQYSGLENSTDCIVHGVTKSRTRPGDFHFTPPGGGHGLCCVCCPSLTLQAFRFSFTVPPERLSLLPPHLTVRCSSYRPQFSYTSVFKRVRSKPICAFCGWGAPNMSLAAGEQDGGRFTVCPSELYSTI